ncbi:MAG: hypothetical protein ACFE8B_10265 [Candidatus Hermodarchaeota archaeon]
MGKEKKALGIKTTRYFTKSCSKCNFEYPNWFTNCPKCGAAWDEMEAKAFSPSLEDHRKKIKIVVKITEEDFNKAILYVNLIFSADQGKSWYQMTMEKKMDYFIAEIDDIPAGSIIIYYIEVYLENGEKIIENNDNKYYYYKVGVSIGEPEEKPSESERAAFKEQLIESPIEPQRYSKDTYEPQRPQSHVTKDMLVQSTKIPQESLTPQKYTNSIHQSPQGATIFGTPQTKIDPDLKVCGYCNSKIKKMWSTCPICGKEL